MTWQSKKLLLAALAALLFAISILWLITTQVTNSYNIEINRSNLENENTSIAVEQALIAKIERIELIHTMAADKIRPILANHKLTPIDLEKSQEILSHFLELSKISDAIGIINSDNITITAASIANTNLSSPPIFQSTSDSAQVHSSKDTGSIFISQKFDIEKNNTLAIFSKIDSRQLTNTINILIKNKNTSIILFNNNVKILSQTSEAPIFNNNQEAIQLFIQSNLPSKSFTINSNKVSTQINLRRIGNTSLYIATINRNLSNLAAWKHNTQVYVFGCFLMLGLLLHIFYSISRAKRLNQTLILKESKLNASETRFRQMIEAMPIGLILARRQDNLIVYINKPAAQILDIPQASALSKRAFDIYSEKINFSAQVNKVIELNSSQSLECILQRNNGDLFWANVSISIVDVAETQTLLIGIIDISEQKKLEAELKHQATTDNLSGLYNRAYFIHSSNKEIQRIQRHKKNASLLMLDIDHFKRINDNFGHDAGDLVIQIIALICQETLRDIDIIGRLGGEEFAALLPETSAQEAIKVAERLRIAIENRRIKLKNEHIISITSSIGITEINPNDGIIDVPLKRADIAMYASKNKGRNQVQYFDSTPE